MNKLCFEELDCFIDASLSARPTIDNLKSFCSIVKKMGYTGLILGFTDNFELENEPYFGLQHGYYTKSELRSLDEHCKNIGLKLKPHFQTLGHLWYLGKYNTFDKYMDDMEVMLVDDERTYVLVEKMFKSMSESLSSDTIHLGMDEAFQMGRGKHLDIYGYQSRFEIISRHLKRIMEIAEKYGYKRFEMWSDMYLHNLFKPEMFEKSKEEIRKLIEGKIPENVILSHWSYIRNDQDLMRKDLEKHFKLSDNIGFTGAACSWFGYAPDNAHSIRVMGDNLKTCRQAGVKKFNVSMWTGSGCVTSFFTGLPSIYYVAELAYGNTDNLENLDKAKFKDIVGVEFDDFMLMDLPNKPHEDFNYVTPSAKSYFYTFSDALLGITDALLSENTGADYAKCYEKLANVNGGEYKHLFDLMANFCKVLTNKAELGKNLKKYYDSGDKEKLKDVADNVIPLIIEDVKTLYGSVKELFRKEFKPYGMEIVNIRFGGLIKRLEHVAKRIKRFVNGEDTEIAELKETRLNPNIFMYQPNENNYLLFGWNMLVASGWI